MNKHPQSQSNPNALTPTPQSRTLHNPHLLRLRQPLALRLDSKHPMVPLGATPRLKHHRIPRHAELTDQLPPTPPAALLLKHLPLHLIVPMTPPEQTLLAAVPQREARHVVFVRAGPAVLEVDARQRRVAGAVVVEGAVLVQQVRFGQEAGIEVAVAQVQCRNVLVVDVRQLLARALAHRVLEDQQRARRQDDRAAREGRVASRLAEENAGDLSWS